MTASEQNNVTENAKLWNRERNKERKRKREKWNWRKGKVFQDIICCCSSKFKVGHRWSSTFSFEMEHVAFSLKRTWRRGHWRNPFIDISMGRNSIKAHWHDRRFEIKGHRQGYSRQTLPSNGRNEESSHFRFDSFGIFKWFVNSLSRLNGKHSAMVPMIDGRYCPCNTNAQEYVNRIAASYIANAGIRIFILNGSHFTGKSICENNNIENYLKTPKICMYVGVVTSTQFSNRWTFSRTNK